MDLELRSLERHQRSGSPREESYPRKKRSTDLWFTERKCFGVVMMSQGMWCPTPVSFLNNAFLWQERRLSEKEPIDRSIVSLFFSLMCSFIFFLSQGSWWWTCLCFPFFSLVHHHDNRSISSSLNGISLALHSVRERRDQERGMRLIAWTLC